jgi:hypothetical protein
MKKLQTSEMKKIKGGNMDYPILPCGTQCKRDYDTCIGNSNTPIERANCLNQRYRCCFFACGIATLCPA